jgi:outer membrane protein TolC
MNPLMTTVLATTLVGGAVLGSSRPAAAAGAESADLVLGLDQALQLARTRNRTLTVEKARLAQAQTNVEQAWSSLFPTVAAQGKYSHNYKEFVFDLSPPGMPGSQRLLIQPKEQLDAAVSFTAPIIAPAAYPALRAVKAGVRGAEAGFKAAEAGLLLNVAQTFYAASIADEVVLARQSNVAVAKATLGNAQARFDAGTVTKVDLDRAQLALVRAEQGEREARLGQERTYRALATLIQERRPFKVKFETVVPQKHDERELDLALKLRPEFSALQASAESAASEANAQGWRWAPTLSAFGNARKFNYDNFARDRYSWAVGGQLDWLLFDGGTRDAARHQARARAAEAQANAEVLRDTIRDDLADGNRQLETKQRGAEAAERSVALAKEALDLVRVQYEAGSVTQVDLLQAQDQLVSAQEALAQAHYDVAAADLSLRHAAGTFPGK